MPANTINVTRPGEFGNPFPVGSYAKIGNGGSGFAYLVCHEAKYAKSDMVYIADNKIAVELFRQYRTKYPLPAYQKDKLKGKNLACFCKEGEPCHADVLIELANG